MPPRPPLASFFTRPPLSSFFSAPRIGDDEEEPWRVEARRLREEREAEMRAAGFLPPELAGPERAAGFTDRVDRFGTAILSIASAPVDIAGLGLDMANAPPGQSPEWAQGSGLLGRAARALTPLAQAARQAIPGGEMLVGHVLPAEVAAARGALGAVERTTGLPFTSESQQRHRERYRELSKPFSPGVEALEDTIIEGGGAVVNPLAGGLAALKGVRGVGAAAARAAGAVERRVAPALRAEVEALLPTLAGKTRRDLQVLAAGAQPGSALEKAVERAAAQLEAPGSHVPPRAAVVAPAVAPEEAAARLAQFRQRTAPAATRASAPEVQPLQPVVAHRYLELSEEAQPQQLGLFAAAEPPLPRTLMHRAQAESDLAGQRLPFDWQPVTARAEGPAAYIARRVRAVEPPPEPGMGVVRSPLGQPAVVGEALREYGAGPPPPPSTRPRQLAALEPQPTTTAGRAVASLRRFLADNFVSESAGASLEFRDPAVRRYIAKELPLAKERAQSEAARFEIAAKPAFSRFERAVRDAAGGDRAAAAALRADATAARVSRDWSALPEPVAAAGQEIGQLVDGLSQRYVDEGLLTTRQAEIFRANTGGYLHRSYQAFDAPGFFEAVRGTESWGRAFRYLRDTMPEATDEELAGVMWQLATREEQKPPPAFGRRSFPRKDLTNLRERKEIAEPVRELMGEYDDYLLNASRTVGKMAYDLSMHRMLKRVAGELEAMGVAVRPRRVEQQLPGGAVLRDVSPGGHRMASEIVGGANVSPLDGLMTTPDLARFFNEAGAAAHTGVRSLFERSVGALKIGKTVWSPATQLRNAESWPLMTLAQGRGFRRMLRGGSPIALPGTEAGRNLSLALRAVGGELAADVAPASRMAAVLDEGPLRQLVLEQAELGVIHTGTNSGELAEWGRMASAGGRGPVPMGSPRAERAKDALRTAGRAGSGLYRASDDAGKSYNHLEESLDLAWMYHMEKPAGHPDRVRWSMGHTGEPGADGLPATRSLRVEAAEIVKQQLQTYGRSIPLARKLARNPLVGPFVTFQFEMPRNLVNATKRGAHEIDLWRQTGNPRALAMGTARLAGVVTGFSAIAALDVAIGALGATAAGKAIGLDGAEHTSDDTEAVRRLTAPPWARYATPLILNIDGESVTYVDGSGIDPYSIVPQIAVALTEPETAPEKLYALADVVTQRFMAPELAAKAGVEFVTRTRIEGPLWDTQAREQTGNRGYNLWRTLGPGALLTAENVARGAGVLNPERGHGRRYELGSELVASLGPRVQTFKFEGSFKGRTTSWNQLRRDVSATYTKEATRARPGTEDILAAKKQAEEDWRTGWMQMQEWTNSARQLLGHSHSQKEAEGLLWSWMRDSGVSAVLARQLLAGQYMPYYAEYRYRTAARGSVR